MKLYSDLMGLAGDLSFVTKFQILTGEHLPFEYHIDKTGVCITDADNDGIERAEEQSSIHIIDRKVPRMFNRFMGGPEAVLNGTLKFVTPKSDVNGTEGADLDIQEFGGWKCTRCGHVSFVPIKKGRITKPYDCDNNSCGRRGPFTEEFPTDLIKPIWKLPLPPIESSSEEIYQEIYAELKNYLVLKDDEYSIITLWIMASWLVDDFQTCPYLCLIAPKSSGKTTVLNILGELAYRSVSAISVTAPSLFRAIEMWHITLLLDEAEFQVKQDTEAGQALYGCLNGGYKRGSYAIRTEGDSGSRIPSAYDVFGFKAISATKLFHPTLESRSIVINMVQGMPRMIMIDPGKMAMLRAKLLYWRYETLGKLPIVFPDSKVGRLIEMFIPLFTVAQVFKNKPGEQVKISHEDIVTLLNEKISEMENDRQEEEKGSEEAIILSAIYDLSGNEEITVKDIALQLKWINEYTEAKDSSKTYAKIGKKLKILGIKTRHTNHGNVVQHLEPGTLSVLEELYKRFLVISYPK